MNEYKKYLSPYTWRYSSLEMKSLWSEVQTRKIWRRIWVALAEVQLEFGITTQEQVQDLCAHLEDIDVTKALEIESLIQHDLMAEIKTYAEQCPVGGGIIHLGATSVDVKDNATVLQMREALALILKGLRLILVNLSEKIIETAETRIISFTHLQPAEPTTLGYRLAQYAQDLLEDWNQLKQLQAAMKGKGFKGAVGTSASYAALVGIDHLPRFETLLAEKLGINFFPVTTQVYPRKQDYRVLAALAGLGASLHKFAFDLRFLQSPPIGELSEPFGKAQIGSSAMPFKRNPIHSEKIDSLSRLLAQFPRTAWDNAANSLLERTMDDSANRRSILPEAFLIADELLLVTHRIVDGLIVNEAAMARNLAVYGPFAATERVLMALAKAGADRQRMHGILRKLSLSAWDHIRNDAPNPLTDYVVSTPEFLDYLPQGVLITLMDASHYVGDAPLRARDFAAVVKAQLETET